LQYRLIMQASQNDQAWFQQQVQRLLWQSLWGGSQIAVWALK
jgi:hypothetical protein